MRSYRIWINKDSYIDITAACPSLAIKKYECMTGHVYFWKIEKI